MTVVKFIGLLFFLANTEQVTMASDWGGGTAKIIDELVFRSK